MKAHRALQEKAVASIEGAGMCLSDFAVLEVLLHKGPSPVNTIANLIGLTSGSGTTAIDRLEKRELVERRFTAEDRRARVVHLTANGRRLITKVFAKHEEDMEKAVEVLSPAEREQLIELLKKVGKGVPGNDVQQPA